MTGEMRLSSSLCFICSIIPPYSFLLVLFHYILNFFFRLRDRQWPRWSRRGLSASMTDKTTIMPQITHLLLV
ncbi:hypothetical protein BDW67DRAFT_85843 [Aspergillus spinulosporus]